MGTTDTAETFEAGSGPLLAALLRKINGNKWNIQDTMSVQGICQKLESIIERSPSRTIQNLLFLSLVPIIHLSDSLTGETKTDTKLSSHALEALLFLSNLLLSVLQKAEVSNPSILEGMKQKEAIKNLLLFHLNSVIAIIDSSVATANRHCLSIQLDILSIILPNLKEFLFLSFDQQQAQILFDLLNYSIILVQMTTDEINETDDSLTGRLGGSFRYDKQLAFQSIRLYAQLIQILALPALKAVKNRELKWSADSVAARSRALLVHRYPGLIILSCCLITQGRVAKIGRVSLKVDILQALESLIVSVMADKINASAKSSLFDKLIDDSNRDLGSPNSITIGAKKTAINLLTILRGLDITPSHTSQYVASTTQSSDASINNSRDGSNLDEDLLKTSLDVALCSFCTNLLLFCCDTLMPQKLNLVECNSALEDSVNYSCSLQQPSPMTTHKPADLLFSSLIDNLVSSYYSVILSSPPQLSRLSHSVISLLQYPLLRVRIEQRFSNLLKSIDPFKLAVSLHHRSVTNSLVLRILGFLYICSPPKSSTVSSTKAIESTIHPLNCSYRQIMTNRLRHLQPLFQISWTLVYTELVSSTTTCLDEIGFWVEQGVEEVSRTIVSTSASNLFSLLYPEQLRIQRCDSIDNLKTKHNFIDRLEARFVEVDDMLKRSLVVGARDAAVIRLVLEVAKYMSQCSSIDGLLSCLFNIWNEALINASPASALQLPLSKSSWQCHSTSRYPSTFKSLDDVRRCLAMSYETTAVLNGVFESPLSSINVENPQLIKELQSCSNHHLTPLLFDFIEKLTTPITNGGLWNDSSMMFMQHLKSIPRHLDCDEDNPKCKNKVEGLHTDNLNKAFSRKFVSSHDVLIITNLWDIVMMTTLHTINRILISVIRNNKTRRIGVSKSYNSDAELGSPMDVQIATILSRLTTFGYELLLKVGSPYRLVSYSALRLISQLGELYSIEKPERKPLMMAQQFIAQFSPSIIDSLMSNFLCIRRQQRFANSSLYFLEKSGDSLGSSKELDNIGSILLSAIILGSDQIVVSMRDVVGELCQFAIFSYHQHQEASSSQETSLLEPKGYSFPSWVFKVFAAIAKRISLKVRQSQLIEDFVKSESSCELGDSCNEKETISLLASCFLTPTIGFICSNDEVSVDITPFSYSVNSASSALSSDIIESYTFITTKLFESSQLCLLHPNNQIAYYAHLTCLRTLCCAAINRSHLLQQIFKLWPSVIHSLNRQSITSTTLLCGLIIREILRLSSGFVAPRFQIELFPVLCKLLEDYAPANESDQINRRELFKVQLNLFDIIIASGCNSKLIKPLVGRCCGIAVRFLNPTTASELIVSSTKLLCLCLSVDFNTTILILSAVATIVACPRLPSISNNDDKMEPPLILEIPRSTKQLTNNDLNAELKSVVIDLLGHELTVQSSINVLSVDSGLTPLFDQTSKKQHSFPSLFPTMTGKCCDGSEYDSRQHLHTFLNNIKTKSLCV